ncbi:MAG: biotin/lipoyl-binding protein [Candidatus Firestonebacteria bacterium]|nr:biotin/lipoyl-binding protein [Candidatus Firestonebacteria bacterium]
MELIKEIFDVLKETDIYEFKWETSQYKIFLSRLSKEEKEFEAYIDIPRESALKQNLQIEVLVKPVQIKSTMVGTFYSSHENSNKSYVTKGATVKKGQTICIIETMKVINKIQSEFNGKILDIYVENGKPVEYGQLLFTILPE